MKTQPIVNLGVIKWLLCSLFTVLVGFIAGASWHSDNIQPDLNKAYTEGKRKAEEEFSWKKLALDNQNATRKLCKAWWFDSNATERSIK